MSAQDEVNEKVRRASEVQAKYADDLMSKPHVIGVAIGYCTRGGERTSDIGVIVMVDSKLPRAELAEEEAIPAELDGVRIDVQETGVFSAY